MIQLRDPDELAALIRENAREDAAWIDQVAWLANPRNFALVDGHDLGLFEAKGDWPGPLHAHVMFASRGKDALRIARAMLVQAFAFGATEICGETPVKFKDAWLFARLLGFKEIGREERPGGLTILSRVTPTHFGV